MQRVRNLPVQRKSVAVKRGLFLLRYAASGDTTRPPFVTVTSDERDGSRLAILADPDVEGRVLSLPGDCLVVRALENTTLRLEVTPSVLDGSVEATIQLERLTNGAAEQRTGVGRRRAADPVPVGPVEQKLEVVGHVARRGDVTVGADSWVAGPVDPSRIEGLTIRWLNQPVDASLRYAAITEGDFADADMVEHGSFVGTRGRSRPIRGVAFELVGRGASRYRVVAEGLFLGSLPVRSQGSRVTLAGPTGEEPLVGLRLSIEDRAARGADAGQGFRGLPQSEPSRVRVFRGSAAGR